jgi:hypothetical protein
VEFSLDAQGPSTLVRGTLAADHAFEGWNVPAGYTIERGRSWWRFSRLEGSKVATALDPAQQPHEATSVDTQGGGTRYQTTRPWTARLGEVTFAAGTLTRSGPFVEGTLVTPLTVGPLKVPAGSQVSWCEGSGLQTASKAHGLRLGRFTLDAVQVIHESEPVDQAEPQVAGQPEPGPRAHRNASGCHDGAPRTLLVLPPGPCCYGGGAPPVEPRPIPVPVDGPMHPRIAELLEEALRPCGRCSPPTLRAP